MALLDAVDGLVPTSATSIVAVMALAILTYTLLFLPPYDRREPPMLQPRIPFLGHLIGMFTQGASFLSSIECVLFCLLLLEEAPPPALVPSC